MEIVYIFATAIFAFMFVQVVLLKSRLRAQQREFAEYKSSVVVVPIPKKKQSPWLPVLAISTLLLAVAVFVLALR